MSRTVRESFDIVKGSYDKKTIGDMTSYYDQWAAQYEIDVDTIGWVGWRIVVDLLLQHAGIHSHSRILDYGCGTGYAGHYLKRRMPDASLTGLDVSPRMLEYARSKGVYDRLVLIEGSDALNDDAYRDFDAVICSGVFTDSHMLAGELAALLLPLRPGGVLVVSARESYCLDSGIVQVVRSLCYQTAEKLFEWRGAPYQENLEEAGARGAYWVLQQRWRMMPNCGMRSEGGAGRFAL